MIDDNSVYKVKILQKHFVHKIGPRTFIFNLENGYPLQYTEYQLY